jgi:hypothetical protein
MEVVISKTFDELVRDLGLTIESLRDDVESLKDPSLITTTLRLGASRGLVNKIFNKIFNIRHSLVGREK